MDWDSRRTLQGLTGLVMPLSDASLRKRTERSNSLTITPAADAKNRTPNPMNFECKLTAENNCSCIKPTNIGTNVENPRPSQNLIGAPVIVTAHLCFTILISGQLQSHPSRNQLPFPSLL